MLTLTHPHTCAHILTPTHSRTHAYPDTYTHTCAHVCSLDNSTGELVYSDTVLTCLSPAGVGSAHLINVIVNRIPSAYHTLLWGYRAPEVDDVSPRMYSPQDGQAVVISGRNFGRVPSAVYFGPFVCEILFWSDASVTVRAPLAAGQVCTRTLCVCMCMCMDVHGCAYYVVVYVCMNVYIVWLCMCACMCFLCGCVYVYACMMYVHV